MYTQKSSALFGITHAHRRSTYLISLFFLFFLWRKIKEVLTVEYWCNACMQSIALVLHYCADKTFFCMGPGKEWDLMLKNVCSLQECFLKPYSIVLVDLNEFPSIFLKVQHSQSRHQETTSNLLRINLKGILKFNKIWPLEVSYTCTKILVLCNFCRKLMVSDKRFTGLLELIQLYKQTPLEKFFIFIIYPNYTLALNCCSRCMLRIIVGAWWSNS